METENKIMWIIKGKILNYEKFKENVETVVHNAKEDSTTKLYWWTHTHNCKGYCDIDAYESSEAALKHLELWRTQAEKFKDVATVEKVIVLGNPSEKLKAAFESMTPKYMNFYGGYIKDNTKDTQSENSDIIWTLKGEIKDEEKFRNSMNILTSKTEAEEGSLAHWWTVSADAKYFHVLEHYADSKAAMEHLKTWDEYGHLFLEAVELKSFMTFSKLTAELSEALEGMHPDKMTFINGFSR